MQLDFDLDAAFYDYTADGMLTAISRGDDPAPLEGHHYRVSFDGRGQLGGQVVTFIGIPEHLLYEVQTNDGTRHIGFYGLRKLDAPPSPYPTGPAIPFVFRTPLGALSNDQLTQMLTRFFVNTDAPMGAAIMAVRQLAEDVPTFGLVQNLLALEPAYEAQGLLVSPPEGILPVWRHPSATGEVTLYGEPAHQRTYLVTTHHGLDPDIRVDRYLLILERTCIVAWLPLFPELLEQPSDHTDLPEHWTLSFMPAIDTSRLLLPPNYNGVLCALLAKYDLFADSAFGRTLVPQWADTALRAGVEFAVPGDPHEVPGVSPASPANPSSPSTQEAPEVRTVQQPPIPRGYIPAVLWYELRTSETLENGQMHTQQFVLDSYKEARVLIDGKRERSVDFTYRLHLTHLLEVGQGENFTPHPGVTAGPHAGYRYEYRNGSYRQRLDDDGDVFHLVEIRKTTNVITRYSASMKVARAYGTTEAHRDPAALWRELEEHSPHMLHRPHRDHEADPNG